MKQKQHKEKQEDFRETAHIKKGKKIVERIVKASQKQGGWIPSEQMKGKKIKWDKEKVNKLISQIKGVQESKGWEKNITDWYIDVVDYRGSENQYNGQLKRLKDIISIKFQEAEKKAYEKAYQDVAKRFRIREQEAEKRGFDKGYRACQMEEI